MPLINPAPITEAVADQNGKAVPSWAQWFQQVYGLCFDVQNSGTTAQRPTKFLYPGKFYFDTSLGANGKPIWLNKNSSGWVLADGTAA